VLATYMARRETSFVINAPKARHINVAHGLYPREEIQSDQLAAIICYLNGAQSRHIGRTYAGGLTKFEPSEMSRIPI
ncbi:SAM-dependent methyltransferase, partial [Enterococcus hirae]